MLTWIYLVNTWPPVCFQIRFSSETRQHSGRTSDVIGLWRISHPLLRNFWALPARLCARTTPPVALASYASRLPDSRETLHGPPPCTMESTPAPHFGLTPGPVPAHNAPKVLDIPGKSWDFPGISHAFSSNPLQVFPPFCGMTFRLGLPDTCCNYVASMCRPLDFRTAPSSDRLCRPVCSASEHGAGCPSPGTLVSDVTDVPLPE